jgi:hypothetical protein
MKQFLLSLFVFTLLTGTTTNAQEQQSTPTTLKHEINIGFSNLLHRNEQPLTNPYPYYFELANSTSDLRYYPYPDYIEQQYHSPKFGLGYKFHLAKLAFRIQANFGFEDHKSDEGNNGNFTSDNEASQSSLLTRVGVEYNFIQLDKFQFYGALDGILQQSDQSFESMQISTDQEYTSSTTISYKGNGGGFSLGLRYFVHQHVSLSTETRMDYILYETKTKWKNESTGAYESKSESKNNEKSSLFLVTPLAVFSVNVHF